MSIFLQRITLEFLSTSHKKSPLVVIEGRCVKTDRCACLFGKNQQQFFLSDFINQQPVGRDMAFAIAGIVACQRVVAIFCRERLASCKHADHIFHQRDIVATLDDALVIFSASFGSNPFLFNIKVLHYNCKPLTKERMCLSCVKKIRFSGNTWQNSIQRLCPILPHSINRSARALRHGCLPR